MDQSTCAACHSDCKECARGGSNECFTCAAKNKYLVRQSTSVSYGSCVEKEVYGTFAMTLYVKSINTAPNPLDVQLITGLIGNPFNSIQDAIIRGYELSALYKYSEITIVLMTGDHAMVRDGSGTYMPSRFDDWSQNTKFIIKS